MESSRDRYNQRVEVSFSAPGTAALVTELRRRRGSIRTILAALPSALATLRKVLFDLTAVALPFVVVIFFLSIVMDETIIIEAPSVPQALQERGITPELLTQMLQVRIQEIRASAVSREISGTEDPAQDLPAPKTLQGVIDEIHRSHEAPVSSDPASGPRDPKVIAVDEILARMVHKEREKTDAGRLIEATEESIETVIGPYTSSPEVTKTAELVSPAEDPLVIATAGLHFSLDSLAHWARGILGIGTQRRLTVSLVCKTADCGDGALAFHVVASAERAVAAAADLKIGQLGQVADAAAAHLFDTFDPQVLARHRFREGEWEKAKNLAERVLSERHEQGAWAHNLLGLIDMQEKDWDAAKGHLDAALSVDPEHVPAHLNLGVVQFQKGEFEAAEARYKDALRLDPEHVVAYTNLGHVLLRMCKWEDAVNAYEQALKVDPQSPPARTSLDLIKKLPALKPFFPAKLKPAEKPHTLAEVFYSAEFCQRLAWKSL